jgi:hypothetical protein
MNRNLSQSQFFHASNHKFDVGDMVVPRRDLEFRPPGHPFHDPDSWEDGEREQYEDALDSSAGHTYFSDNLEHGRSFASRIYSVEPTGKYWPDHTPGTYESQHPLRVTGFVEAKR